MTHPLIEQALAIDTPYKLRSAEKTRLTALAKATIEAYQTAKRQYGRTSPAAKDTFKAMHDAEQMRDQYIVGEPSPFDRAVLEARLADAHIEWAQQAFANSVKRTIDTMQRTVEEMQRMAARHEEESDPVRTAYALQHTLLWAVPNANLEGMTTEAADLASAQKTLTQALDTLKSLLPLAQALDTMRAVLPVG